MITKKLWNSLTSSSRKKILELIVFDNFAYWYSQLKEPYNHDFGYNAIGRKLKEILACCILQNDGSIKVSVCIKPNYIKNNNSYTKAKKSMLKKNFWLENASEKTQHMATVIHQAHDEVIAHCEYCGKPLSRSEVNDFGSLCERCYMKEYYNKDEID